MRNRATLPLARLMTLFGGGKTAPDRAALYNSALVRYLDYNDSYLAKNETCHPSDNLGAVLAASEYAHKSGNVKAWRTDAAAKIIGSLGLEKVMFEATEPEVFAWYIKNYGPKVNVFVDRSQIVQLECLRAGIWGTKSLWGRVLAYKG